MTRASVTRGVRFGSVIVALLALAVVSCQAPERRASTPIAPAPSAAPDPANGPADTAALEKPARQITIAPAPLKSPSTRARTVIVSNAPPDARSTQPPAAPAAPRLEAPAAVVSDTSTPRARTPVPPARLSVTDHDPIHDRASPAYRVLQRPSRALVGFPLDRRGRVDWVRALEQGRIEPRAELTRAGTMQILDADIVMTNTRSMPHVVFPHRAHTQWLSCDSCHPKPFRKQAGANATTMDEIFKGRSCGVCHDKVAFSTFVCERCHSRPHAGSPAKWW